MMKLPFNADVGEGSGNEAWLMPFLGYCSIACGGHAGDEATMNKVLDLAIIHGVRIGAHPSYPDKANFGRHEIKISHEALYDVVYEQVLFLYDLVSKKGTSLSYIKPHGALYHSANERLEIAEILISVIQHIDPSMALMGMPYKAMQSACEQSGIRFISEAFADRAYNDDGTLVSRNHPQALLTTKEVVATRVNTLLFKQQVDTISGKVMNLAADSICFHSDTENAAELVQYAYKTIYATS